MPQMQVPAKLLPLIQKPKRFKIIIGGRGSGKSQTVADILLMKSQVEAVKVGCFREFQNSISDSVLSLLEEEIERLELEGFDIQNASVTHEGGGEFLFKGLARNVESVKSMHGFNIFFVEEAQTLSYKSIKILTPTLRTEGSEIWMVGNPRSSADPFSQRFIMPFQKELDRNGYYEDDLHLVIMCNYCDNPFFPQVLEEERQYDYDHLDRAEYDHIWLGKFNDTVDNAIIKTEWFDAAIDAHKKLGFKPKGAVIASYDPSDSGDDEQGYAVRHGSVFIDVQESDIKDVNDGCDWATSNAISQGVDLFTWDCDGMGISLKRQVGQAFDGKKVDIDLFKGSQSVDFPDKVYERETNIKNSKTNRETFKNKRSQYYWMLRDRFYNTYRAVVKGEYVDPDNLISLSSDIKCLDRLRSEVCRIPLKDNGNGLIQIMSKQDMAKLEISSPNMADALMMTMVIPQVKKKAKRQLNYKKVSIA